MPSRPLETSSYFPQLSDLQGPGISRQEWGVGRTQEKGSEPELSFQGFGTKGSALELGHSAVDIESLCNGYSFSPGASLKPAAC